MDRLKALAIQSHPARHSDSDIGPELDPDSTNSLSHRPMGLFGLLCPYELSNEAFVTSASIVLETPLPHARYLLGNMHTYSHIDVFGDFLLNNSAHASSSRFQSHNCIANLLADLACQHGIPATTKSVPCRVSDSQQLEGTVIDIARSRLELALCGVALDLTVQIRNPIGDGLRTGTCLQLQPRVQAKQSFVHGIRVSQAIPVPCLLSRPGLCFRPPC